MQRRTDGRQHALAIVAAMSGSGKEDLYNSGGGLLPAFVVWGSRWLSAFGKGTQSVVFAPGCFGSILRGERNMAPLLRPLLDAQPLSVRLTGRLHQLQTCAGPTHNLLTFMESLVSAFDASLFVALFAPHMRSHLSLRPAATALSKGERYHWPESLHPSSPMCHHRAMVSESNSLAVIGQARPTACTSRQRNLRV